MEISRLRVPDIPECIDIARRSFDHFEGNVSAVQNWFDARVLNNPWQHQLDGIGVAVRDAGKLIAFRAMFAQPWWIGGQPTVMAFAAHTCIEPAYRGCGLGGRMIANSREVASLTGSTSAGNITQKIYAKQGFVAVGGVADDFFRLRVSFVGSMQSRLGSTLGSLVGGATDAFLHGVEIPLGDARGFRLEPMNVCTEEFDELWARARLNHASCLERSSKYLNWRVFDFPTQPLSLVALRDARHQLRGYAVWHQQQYSNHVSCAVLRDLFLDNYDEAALRAFLFLAVRNWRSTGMTWVSLEVASNRLTPLFQSLGYEPIPSNGNRYQVHSQSTLSQEAIHGWFRSGLDGDYFDTRPPSDQAGAKNET
ncbi:MAG: hypothetical protein Q7T97_12860 [Burkholderiaceae bacterium]|nr:hypothetical protein [Burkholderiaceae bacterium]